MTELIIQSAHSSEELLWDMDTLSIKSTNFSITGKRYPLIISDVRRGSQDVNLSRKHIFLD